MSTDITVERETARAADFLGHPRGLWMLLVVTAGFNYVLYGFRAFLAPYIAQQFFGALGAAAAERQADLLTSGFLALVYATPIIGGYVADRGRVCLRPGEAALFCPREKHITAESLKPRRWTTAGHFLASSHLHFLGNRALQQ